MTNETKTYIGIDVGKEELEIAKRGETKSWQTNNTEEGIGKLIEWIGTQSNCQVVIEATGGLEMKAARALMLSGIPVTVANPTRVRAYARATGELRLCQPGFDVQRVAGRHTVDRLLQPVPYSVVSVGVGTGPVTEQVSILWI